MLIGLHHVGRAVCDLDATADDLVAITGWEVTRTDGRDDPLVAGRDVRRTALAHGPNGWLELVGVEGTPEPRRGVHEAGLRHAAVQAPRIEDVVERLDRADVDRHPGPVELGTGYKYLYVRDAEHLVTEVEGLPFAPADVEPWLAHGALVTADIDALRTAYEALLGTEAQRTVRVREHPEFDRGADLADVDVTATWVPTPTVPVEMWQYHHPTTEPATLRRYEDPGTGHLAFESDAIDADIERGLRAGFTLVDPPSTHGGVEIARLRDPDGNWVELLRFEAEGDDRSLRQRPDLHRAARMNEVQRRGRT